MDMIERAARALYISFFDDGAIYDGLSNGAKKQWQHCVRAVITEMREPDDAMMEAALTTSTRFGKPAMARIWQAMIDQALKG